MSVKNNVITFAMDGNYIRREGQVILHSGPLYLESQCNIVDVEYFMSGFGQIEPRTPLAAVNVHDLKGVWCLIQSPMEKPGDQGIGTYGLDARLISQHCESGAAVAAVFFRAVLLQHLFRTALLDDWREGNEPADPVFLLGATFPMEEGVQGFDPAAFIERLRHPGP
ncbi:MAG: hypothetical protein JWO80_4225 [Bryobacterales bacterium]|nr:hypothetical protein [Bryobacterales bacterium]